MKVQVMRTSPNLALRIVQTFTVFHIIWDLFNKIQYLIWNIQFETNESTLFIEVTHIYLYTTCNTESYSLCVPISHSALHHSSLEFLFAIKFVNISFHNFQFTTYMQALRMVKMTYFNLLVMHFEQEHFPSRIFT
jgi:hypothetical protein